jgi:hypothetical protein
VADEPVGCELVSGADSLLTGKFTGKLRIFGHSSRKSTPKSSMIQRLATEIPRQQNRELIRLMQGIGIAYQGSYALTTHQMKTPRHCLFPNPTFDSNLMGLHVGFFHDPDIVFVGGRWTAFKFFVRSTIRKPPHQEHEGSRNERHKILVQR